jgi:uncharacterized protein YkwD
LKLFKISYFRLVILLFSFLAVSMLTSQGEAFNSLDRSALLYSGCGGDFPPSSHYEYEQEVVEIINHLRDSQGLPPLKRTEELDYSARFHAVDMGQDDYFTHDSFDRSGGGLWKVCSWSDRISGFYPNWNYLGENLAAGQSTPEDAVGGWMGSEGHRANIFNPDFWETGVGYSQGYGYYQRYWTQDFGRRWDRYPLVINLEAATTDSREVDLYIYGTWEEMRLRNGLGDWTDWMPFSNHLKWELDSIPGEQTVSAEMRNGSSTATSSDSIYLNLEDVVVLTGLPENLTFYYSLEDREVYPPVFRLQPINGNGGAGFSWELQQDEEWWDISPATGEVPAIIVVTPGNLSDIENAPEISSLTVEVVDCPYEVLDSPQTIELRLVVVDGPARQLFIPAINR